MGQTIVKEVIERLKDSNIRITPQRYAVLEYLIENHNHPTADDIYRSLEQKFPNMSVATVYNNLRLFTGIGFVKELSYGDSSSRFDFIDYPHYHAICKECGTIVDFEHPELETVEKKALELTNFQSINDHRLEVYGICKGCHAKPKEEKKVKEVKAVAAVAMV